MIYYFFDVFSFIISCFISPYKDYCIICDNIRRETHWRRSKTTMLRVNAPFWKKRQKPTLFRDEKMKKTIRRKTFIAAALMSAMCTATYSFADVIKVTDDARLLQHHDAQYFSQSGLSGEEAKVIETGGADLPLSLAASLIIPENWKIESSGDYENAIISWSGGVSWPLIVRNFSENEEIYVNLDWIKKVASIHVPGRAAVAMSSADDNQTQSLKESREAFIKAQDSSFKKQERYKQQTEDQKAQFESILEQQRNAQESNQALIARINESRTDAINQLSLIHIWRCRR